MFYTVHQNPPGLRRSDPALLDPCSRTPLWSGTPNISLEFSPKLDPKGHHCRTPNALRSRRRWNTPPSAASKGPVGGSDGQKPTFTPHEPGPRTAAHGLRHTAGRHQTPPGRHLRCESAIACSSSSDPTPRPTPAPHTRGCSCGKPTENGTPALTRPLPGGRRAERRGPARRAPGRAATIPRR